jgi:hypothetical protein
MVLSALVVTGCGDPAPTCPIRGLGVHLPYCPSAANLALRESDELVIQQPEVDYYYDLQRSAYTQLPILRTTGAQIDDAYGADGYSIQTTYDALIEPWSAATVRTDVAAIDKWFADAGAFAVTPTGTSPDGYATFFVQYSLFISGHVLEDGISSIPNTRFPPGHAYPPVAPDLVLTWDGSDALLTFLVGWGDCSTACQGTHTWQARVAPDLTTSIEDLGGDEVPPDVAAQAEGIPPPP